MRSVKSPLFPEPVRPTGPWHPPPHRPAGPFESDIETSEEICVLESPDVPFLADSRHIGPPKPETPTKPPIDPSLTFVDLGGSVI